MPDQSYESRRLSAATDVVRQILMGTGALTLNQVDGHAQGLAQAVLRAADRVTPDDHVDHDVLREMGIEPGTRIEGNAVGPDLELHEVSFVTDSQNPHTGVTHVDGVPVSEDFGDYDRRMRAQADRDRQRRLDAGDEL